LNIGCNRDYEMHLFIFFCLQAFTWGCIQKFCFPSPCSESINLCWFSTILWWRGRIFYHVTWNLPHGELIYQKYSMTWYGIFLNILFYYPVSIVVATLALGSWPRQRGCKGEGQEETRETHHILPGMQESVREWTLTLPRQLPL